VAIIGTVMTDPDPVMREAALSAIVSRTSIRDTSIDQNVQNGQQHSVEPWPAAVLHQRGGSACSHRCPVGEVVLLRTEVVLSGFLYCRRSDHVFCATTRVRTLRG
jgi:hypothetical protein